MMILIEIQRCFLGNLPVQVVADPDASFPAALVVPGGQGTHALLPSTYSFPAHLVAQN